MKTLTVTCNCEERLRGFKIGYLHRTLEDVEIVQDIDSNGNHRLIIHEPELDMSYKLWLNPDDTIFVSDEDGY